MRRYPGVFALCALLGLAGLTEALSAAPLPEVIGLVRTLNGEARFAHRGQEVPVRVGQALVVGAALSTGAGSLGLSLNDGTRLVLGADTRLQLEAFRFAPARGELECRVRLEHGSLYLAGGALARLADEALQVETPAGRVSLRGSAALLVRASR